MSNATKATLGRWESKNGNWVAASFEDEGLVRFTSFDGNNRPMDEETWLSVLDNLKDLGFTKA